MIVSIQQPRYLPWLGYFDRIAKSDVHIVLDHVTLSKGDFVNRTRIQQRDGRVMWLTIPVSYGKPINETRVEYGRWVGKHWTSLAQAYGWLPPHAHLPTTLSRFCLETILPSLWEGTPVKLSSDLGGPNLGAKSTLILNLCKEVGADTYLSGPNGRSYLDLSAFDKAGVEVRWHDYPTEPPVLSAIHHLFGGADDRPQPQTEVRSGAGDASQPNEGVAA